MGPKAFLKSYLRFDVKQTNSSDNAKNMLNKTQPSQSFGSDEIKNKEDDAGNETEPKVEGVHQLLQAASDTHSNQNTQSGPNTQISQNPHSGPDTQIYQKSQSGPDTSGGLQNHGNLQMGMSHNQNFNSYLQQGNNQRSQEETMRNAFYMENSRGAYNGHEMNRNRAGMPPGEPRQLNDSSRNNTGPSDRLTTGHEARLCVDRNRPTTGDAARLRADRERRDRTRRNRSRDRSRSANRSRDRQGQDEERNQNRGIGYVFIVCLGFKHLRSYRDGACLKQWYFDQ